MQTANSRCRKRPKDFVFKDKITDNTIVNTARITLITSRNLGFISWIFLFFTGLPNPVGICVAFRRLFIVFRVGKSLACKPLLSGVFVHRVFCAYFVRFEGAGVMRRFLWCT